jgi:hypothetical protein
MKVTDVFLVFSPKQTRPYSYNYYDLVNNLFLPFTQLEAVCCTEAGAEAIAQEIVERLQKDCTEFDLQHGNYNVRKDWQDAIQLMWQQSIGVIRSPLGGIRDGIIQFKKVHVVLETMTENVSGAGRTYDRLCIAKVTANRTEARAYAEPGHIIVEHDLIGFSASSS